jgi:hypothetical protein
MAMAIMGAASGAFAADQATLGLPDVSVTAPKRNWRCISILVACWAQRDEIAIGWL